MLKFTRYACFRPGHTVFSSISAVDAVISTHLSILHARGKR